ncbi:MAG: CapA family protein [Alphaproteobacteria bacterium]
MYSLLLTGDVMLGRGVDQILPHPCDPSIPDRRASSALEFVHAAERKNGAIPRAAVADYVWGDAIAVTDKIGPAVRIINLETAVTTAAQPAHGEITYRMNPRNADVLRAFRVDCCVLANNHVLDWGRPGLVETLDTLDSLGIAYAGAGRTDQGAWRPAVLPGPEGGRVIVLAMADRTSGVPASWAARATDPGVALLEGSIDENVSRAADAIRSIKTGDDLAIASIHWGNNWGYGVTSAQFEFAQKLIDQAGIDAVHGHSSHHPKQIALHRGRPIMFGCGDLLNDYEGIRGNEEFRPDLVAIYRLKIENTQVCSVTILPFRIRRFRLEQVPFADAEWLARRISQHSRTFETAWIPEPDGTLRVAQIP